MTAFLIHRREYQVTDIRSDNTFGVRYAIRLERGGGSIRMYYGIRTLKQETVSLHDNSSAFDISAHPVAYDTSLPREVSHVMPTTSY